MRLPLTLLALLAAFVLAACGGDGGGATTATQQPAASAPTATATTPAFAEISVQEADARAGDGALLVDVREDDEWAAGHAPAAVHVPLGDLSDAKLAQLDEQRGDGELIFICRSGNRSGQAAAAAQAAGLADVASVAGGMGDWAAAGLPLEPADGEII
jgi:rhodanese-related sulfurtransferase